MKTKYSFFLLSLLIAVTSIEAAPASSSATKPSFADFDLRARAGEHLNVVFFGASLTWGANASDPQLTSYRGLIAQRLESVYPQAHFRFWDAAIGGTGSQLGVFRLDRDVLRHQPDLVFLDFSANDGINEVDPETLASYESLVRRIIVDAHAPVVQMILPFMWDVQRGNTEGMKRRDAHNDISRAYHTAVGDAIVLSQERVKSGQTTLEKLWPYDGVHPGDAGYAVFADAAWDAFQGAVKGNLTCSAPSKMVYADTYMVNARVRISTLGALPEGWRVGVPNPVSAYFDMLMSRWLDDEVIAVYRQGQTNLSSLKFVFNASTLMLYGESTPTSVKYQAFIDGNLVEHKSAEGKQAQTEFDSATLGKLLKGNCHHAQVIAVGLKTNVAHTLEIVPVFSGETNQELRLESICVAGGKSSVHTKEDASSGQTR